MFSATKSAAFEQLRAKHGRSSFKFSLLRGENLMGFTLKTGIDGMPFCMDYVKCRPQSSNETHLQLFKV